MSINLTDEIEVKTKKGKLGAAKQIFLEGDTQTVEKEIQDINSRHIDLSSKHESLSSTVSEHTKQIERNQSQITANKSAQDEKNISLDANMAKLNTRDDQITELVKGVTATGGASVATAVTYDNTSSQLVSATVQGAVDELQGSKINKTSISQEFGDSEDKVVSQSALPFRYIQNEEFIFAKVDAEDRLLFGIEWDGTPRFGKTSAVEDRLQEQVTLLAEKVATIIGDEDTNNVIDTMNELKTFFANIENTQSLTDILTNLDNVAKNLDKTTIKDEEGNVQDTPFRVIENEEFLKAIVDAEDRVLFGFYRATGKPYYPQNDMYHISHSEEFLWIILDTANHPLLGIKKDGTCWAAKAQWLDDIKAIKEALSSIDETLKTFQPKEDGKGLINMEIADSFFYISNDEYIIAVVDAEDRILAGIKYDAQPYFPNHEMYSVITNDEWLYAIIDTEDKVLGGFRADDGHMIVGCIDISTFISNAIVDIADIKECISHLSTIDNDEYFSVETDADGKVLGYTAPDGSHYFYKVKSETIDAKVNKEEGKSLIDADVADAHYAIEDPEGRTEIITDAEGRVLGYRDSEGTHHEHKISTTHIDLSDEAAKEVNDALKSAGIKMDNPSDFSKDSYVELPLPRIAAQVRIYASKLPTTKQDDIEAEIEYNDKDGNYFRKPVILNSQGSSSMSYIDKKTGERGNIAIDINDGSKIKFGDFPAQDSFHLKKYYIDAFRGQCIVGYHLIEQMYMTRPYGERRPWDYLNTNNSVENGTGSISKDFDNCSKSHPDGFPIRIIWVNSSTKKETVMGVYAWNLKKSREVYNVDKKKAENIILDGKINSSSLFGGAVDWTKFEIRNPKSLLDINGNKYDGDNPKELSDTDSLSKKVKGYITRLSGAMADLKTNNNKETFENYFNVPFFIDYFLQSQVTYNADGFDKNWIWGTLDGQKWNPNIYDEDSIFGLNAATGAYIIKNSDKQTILGLSTVLPTYYLSQLYETEIKERYKELRDVGVFTVDNIVGLLESWLNSVGYDNLKEDLTIYNETHSYRSGDLNDGWEIVGWTNKEDTYNNEKTYNEGDTCIFYKFSFKATKTIIGIPPTSTIYEHGPIHIMGFYNSIGRVKRWLVNRINFLDSNYKYNI